MFVLAFILCVSFSMKTNAKETDKDGDVYTETLVKHDLITGTESKIEINVDESISSTSQNTVSPAVLEPLDSPEYFPFNAIGYLTIEFDSGQRTYATAFVVGRSLLLTAAHTVKDENYGTAVSMTFYAGHYMDHRFLDSANATAYYVPESWDGKGTFSPEYDWAFLKLNKQMDTQKVGILTCKVKDMKGKLVFISGYGAGEETTDRDQWVSEGTVLNDDIYVIETDAEGEKGTSGAPMIDFSDPDCSVVGIATAINFKKHIVGPKISHSLISSVMTLDYNY